ncbi:Signal transduction histidine kinase [Clostridium acidisoli DSM 12555]|jgi:signal transduction histidine kinase|uniref:histidine kinase n=1 Tax=Clostridium acidisoli DSM 12555 TaxID=1121291 RepID=A0A1W1XWU1_9CLOT|nr:HAMP domain-containing sensor histidine kinase [Clostridium acidisoli]SMC28337.1 Signal transduction histidine kinase [Clostridium acidisoli DSM 12555]
MKKGLFSKMVTAYTIIIAIFFVIISLVLSIWFQTYYFDNLKSQFSKKAEGIAKLALQYENGDMTIDLLDQYLKGYGDYFNANVMLLDNNGYIYDVSNVENNKVIGKQINGEDISTLRNNQVVTTTGNYHGFFSTSSHTFIVPIVANNTFAGAIMMSTPLSEIKEPLFKVYIIIWLIAVFAIIIAYFVIYYLSQKILIKPLANINEVARKITKGDIGIRVEVKSDDEIGELSKSFNDMADSIAKVENNRREFISNVSHEIRSPITSIKGFIGAIIDGVIPAEKENYYLTLAFEETQRLTRLVNDLLDLSTIESGRVTLNLIKFDINEIIRRTVIKFETKIKEKNLLVDVCFNKESLYVLADIDRMTQVVTNLVDNAIKYVNDGGKVKINTKVRGDKAFISIFNESNSLSEEDLKHIWDRFYKSDKSRTTKTSTGLGLPIVRSILTQHGEDIYVKNIKDSGVEFTFTLKRD